MYRPENGAETVKNVRNTRQKDIVRSVFAKMCNHPTADMVYDEVSKQCPSIGRATVYRILNSFVECGIAIKVPISDGADRFDITVRPHSHAKCRICGCVADVMTEDMLPGVSDSFGFLIEQGSVLYTGLCPECRTK